MLSQSFSRLFSLFLTILICCVSHAADTSMLFSPVRNPEGSSHVRSIIRLPDNRMAFVTLEGVEIFDGEKFSRHHEVTANRLFLPYYTGFHHLYLSHNGKYLWIKNHESLMCLDLEKGIFVTSMKDLVKSLGVNFAPDDFFGDKNERTWWVKKNAIIQPDLNISIPLPEHAHKIIDLIADDSSLSLFDVDGNVFRFALPSGKLISTERVFPEDENDGFAEASLVVEHEKDLYQIRNSDKGGALFHFDSKSNRWERILNTRLHLNTLCITDSTALISTNEGLLTIDFPSMKMTHAPFIKTQSGNLLASEISCIYMDPDGGLWLGLLYRGIFYNHPLSYRHLSIPKENRGSLPAFTPSFVFSETTDGSIRIDKPGKALEIVFPSGEIRPIETPVGNKAPAGEYGSPASFITSNGAILFDEADHYSVLIPAPEGSDSCRVRPIISELSVNGEKILPLHSYNGNTILPKVLSLTDKITLSPDQNFLTIGVSSPHYSAHSATFSFTLEGIDREWHTVKAIGENNKSLTVYYPALSHGDYVFRVKENLPGAPETRLAITVLPYWWQTGWAIAGFIISAIAIAAFVIFIYIRITKRRIARDQREKYLLARIRNLIEEVDHYKTEGPESLLSEKQEVVEQTDSKNEPEQESMSDSDKAFIAKAVEVVEKNLNTPGYSVAQLSRDLCMDRTGLYRKLTTMLDQSPSLFIRDIRLRHAATLLKAKKLSITEISELTGFSSTSYMSKCFQERYGCRPSEYPRKAAEATPGE